MVGWIGLCIIHGVVLLWVGYNLSRWPRLVPEALPGINKKKTAEGMRPLVSICIPARNEEATIGRCLASLQAQTWEDWELLVLDDDSTDATWNIASWWSMRDRRMNVVRGQPLPSGWVGKCHACAQLARMARGRWLLFVDSDTIHEPTMIQRLIQTAEKHTADVLTGFPKIRTDHFFGWLVLPLMHVVIALHLPVWLVLRSKKPEFVAAHGACMLYRREAYLAIGGHGHEDHRASLIEDMTMAKEAKRQGLRVALVDITEVVSCDMYDRPAAVWEGFAKNMFNGLGRSPLRLLGLSVMYLVLYVVPWIGLIWGLWHAQSVVMAWSAGGIVLGIGQKWMIDRRFGVHWFWSSLMAVSMSCLVLLGLRSWWLSVRRRGYRWKDRVYRS